jgi:hypothetical protein
MSHPNVCHSGHIIDLIARRCRLLDQAYGEDRKRGREWFVILTTNCAGPMWPMYHLTHARFIAKKILPRVLSIFLDVYKS